MRSIIPTFAPASLILAVTLLGGAAFAAEPAPKPPDTATIGRVPTPATTAAPAVTPLRPIAATQARVPQAARTKPPARTSTSLPVPTAALNAQQRAKLAGAANATPAFAPAPAGKPAEQATHAPPVKGAPAAVKAPHSPVAPVSGAPVQRGDKPHEVVTVGLATPAAPAAPQVQKPSEPANAKSHARKAAELSTTHPRESSAPARQKQPAPDSTKQEVRP